MTETSRKYFQCLDTDSWQRWFAMQFQDESRSLLQAFNEFVYCAVDRDFIWGFGKQAINCVPG